MKKMTGLLFSIMVLVAGIAQADPISTVDAGYVSDTTLFVFHAGKD